MAAVGSLPRTTVLTLGTTGPTPIDLDDIELTDAQLRPLVANGGFEDGGARWFFSSDRDHLPWHAKNLFVHAFVEQGVLGAVAMLLILAGALLRLVRRPTRLQAHAPTLLAALVGLATVGMVDSLLDMPRITVFLLLLAWLALNLRQPPAR
jgi:O-antigen ligase